MKNLLFILIIMLLQQSTAFTVFADTTIKVGIYDNNPLIFSDSKENGKGLFADIIEYIASKENWRLVYVNGTWQQNLLRLDLGDIDVLCAIAHTDIRSKRYDFNKENILTNWGQLYTKKESGIQEITDLRGKRVSVLKGDIHYEIFQKLIQDFGIDCVIIELDDYHSMMGMVSNGEADACVINRFVGMRYSNEYDLSKSGVIFNPIKLHFAAPKNTNANLLSTVDDYIRKLKDNEDSVYYQSLNKWFGIVSAHRQIPTWLKFFAVTVIIISIFLFFGNLILQIRVKQKTSELTSELNRRIKAETELNEQKRLLDTVINALPFWISLKNKNGEYLLVNQSMTQAHGVEASRYINRHTLDTPELSPGVLKKMVERDKTVIETGSRIKVPEYRMTTVDGDRWRRLVKLPWKNESGEVVGVISWSEDITERKKAEDALKESEEKYRRIFENSVVGIYQSTPGGRFIAANLALAKMLHYDSPQDLMGSISDISSDLYVDPSVRRKFQEILHENGKIDDFEFKARCKDSEEIWLSSTSRSFADENGNVVRYEGINTDITDRKNAETALRESEERYRSILDAAPILFIIHQERVVKYINKAGISVLGAENPEELLGKDIYQFVAPEFKETIQRRVARLDEGELNAPEDIGVVRVDGRPAYVHSTSLPLKYHGEPAVLLMAVDITARKRAEEAMEKRIVALTRPLDGDMGSVAFDDLFSLEDIQQLQDEFAYATGVASIITRPDGMPITKPSNFTRLCRDIIRKTEKGLSNCFQSDSVLGRFNPEGPNIQPCLSGGLWDAGAAIAVSGKHIANWLIGQIREDAQTEDKMRAYAEAIGADKEEMVSAFREVPVMPLEQFQKIAQALSTLANQLSTTAFQNIQQARFISELKNAEEEKARMDRQLYQAQKMESVGRLAGGVAHDFNNMLGIILGHTEMAMEDATPSHPLYADLEEIQKAAERSASLTRQLLAFARKQTISPQVLQLNDTVEGMLKMLRRLIGEDINLDWMPAYDLWPIRMDPSQIDQILANLCINARDAIRGIGIVTIETANLELDHAYCNNHAGFRPGEFVLLTVSDDGCGMNKETMANLFEPFYTSKGVGEGTGLGLATVYGIVKQNEGFINVYSEPGRGTTFNLYLPRYVSKVDPIQKTVETPPTSRGHETILLVEDEQPILNLTKTMLERLGYTVLAADRPIEAIRMAESHPGEIHLVMTDVVMPEMNGRDLVKKLLTFYPSIHRLFMSGYTANVIAHHGILDEGVHFIQKPFSKQNLSIKVREVLDRNDEGK